MKRGRYKRYLCEDVDIPRQTLASAKLNKLRLQNENQGTSSTLQRDGIILHQDRRIEANFDHLDERSTNDNGYEVQENHCSEEDGVSCTGDDDLQSNDDTSDDDLQTNDEDFDNEAGHESMADGDNRSPLYDTCRINRIEADLLILSYSLRHNLNDIALSDLLDLINSFLPGNILPSRHSFLKKYSPASSNTQVLVKYYCDLCYVSLNNELGALMECPSCGNRHKKSDLDAKYQFYIYIPLRNQLIDFINSELYYSIRNSDEEMPYNDVSNGEFYKRTMNRMSPNDLTLQINTDGVNPCKSSVLSLWPIQAMINELPFNLRRQNMFLIGLWYNKEKPYMNMYLKLFVDEMKELSTTGITRINRSDEREISIKVRVLLFTVDSVARPLLQNIHQFNGSFGCTFCLRPGEMWQLGTGGQTRVYRGTEITPLRNLEQHAEDTAIAFQSQSVINGVKGPSILSCLPKPFDITKCFSTDYLHNHLLGVTKLFLDAWFDSTNHGKDWYLGCRIEEFDLAIQRIRPPVEITRTPRSVNHRKQWKGSEYKHFLLYYSICCLQDIMPKKYIEHWSLFVKSTYIFLKSSFTEEEFMSAKIGLETFVEKIEELYDGSFYKFNIHLLLHVPDCVKMFGALWATSGFPFEHYNGVLSRMFFNSTQVPKQIVKRYLRYKNVNWQPMESESCPNHVKQLYSKMSKKRNFGIFQMVKNRITLEDVEMLGRSSVIKISLILKICIEREIGVSDIDEAECYSKCLVRGMMLHCGQLSLSKRCNNVVKLISGSFAIVNKILRTFCGVVLFEVELLDCSQTDSNTFIPSHVRDLYVAVKKTGNISVIQPSKIKQKAVFMQSRCNDTFLIIPLVNHFERD